MEYASRDYRANAYGASYVRQYLEKEKRDKDKEKEKKNGGKSNKPVKVECGKSDGEECGATLGGGETVRPAPKKKEGFDAEGEKNEVLTKEEAAERDKEFAKNRENAPEMRTKTKKQLEEEDEQAKADYKKYGRNKPVSASEKSKF